MLSRKYIWLGILLTMIMVIGLIPAGFAETAPNYGFIPNSGEASVSKVDLVNNLEVARYFTAPRLGQDGNTIPPYNWRTSRIAMDAAGNAWVLNTGADGSGLQGSVVRIQADTSSLTTTSIGAPLLFGTDEAVKVFPVGAAGEMPRAIAIDSAGYIWIGFYSGGQLQKYEYDPIAKSLAPVGTAFRYTSDIKFYEMKFAPDGVLWISSRNSTPTVDGTPGIFSFNGTTFTLAKGDIVPYSLLIADDGTVYATAYSNLLWIRNKDTGIWSSATITDSGENRGMAFDGLGKIWIASTVSTSGGTKVFSYDITSKVVDSYTLTSGTTPVGVGQDAAGNMWAICRTDGDTSGGWIEGFNPATKEKIGAIKVGYRPYAYGDFVVPEIPKYGFCGYKFFNDTEVGLEGWTIELRDQAGVLIATTITDADGKYCFSDLPAGTYTVLELQKTGWLQVFPGGDGKHTITLPEDLENLVVNGDFEEGNSGVSSEYTFVSSPGHTGGNSNLGTLDYPKVYAVGTSPYLYHQLWSNFADHTENDINNLMMIVNGSLDSSTVWTQTIDVDQNSEYTFSFWGASSYHLDTATIEVYINDIKIDTFVAPSGNGVWEEFLALWKSGSDNSAVIKLVCTTNVYDGNDFALDDFSMIKNFNFRNREREKVCFSETAWAYGGTEEENGAENDVAKFNNLIDLNNSNAWGWTNKLVGEVATYPLWAAAGQNILDNGFQVGEVTVTKNGDCVTVVYNIFEPVEYEKYTISETHLWVGATPLPMVLSGGRVKVMIPTSAPGQFDKTVMFEEGSGIAEGGKSATFTICGLDFTGDIWVAAHAVIDWCEFVE